MISPPRHRLLSDLARLALVLGAVAFAFSGIVGTVHTVCSHPDAGPDFEFRQCDLCSQIQGHPAEGPITSQAQVLWTAGSLVHDSSTPREIHLAIPLRDRAPPVLESTS